MVSERRNHISTASRICCILPYNQIIKMNNQIMKMNNQIFGINQMLACIGRNTRNFDMT